MRSRSKYDIFFDTLKAAGHSTEGSSLSLVIKEASLNAQQAREIVIYLLEIGMLQFDVDEKTLTTTSKGWRFKELYESLNNYVRAINKISYISECR
jgi:predicted transcriptional regulator